MRFFLRKSIFFVSFIFIGCSYDGIKLDNSVSKLPKSFNKKEVQIRVDNSWLLDLGDERVLEIIDSAINSNYELKSLFYDIKIKEQELIATNSLLLPSVDLSTNYSKSGEFESSSTSSSSKVALDFTYSVDLWGKLSDSKKSANLELLQTKALYEEAKEQLVSDVVLLYYEILESNRVLELYKKNLKNAQEYFVMIKSRYSQGLSSALDRYLAQNSIYIQMSKITALKNTKAKAIHSLEQLLGEYPKGSLDLKGEIPLLGFIKDIGVPADIIEKKPALSASWNSLLSKNYQLAFAHKQRLPSLNLSSSLEKITSSSSPLSWSLLAALTAPIFNAGELKAQESIALYELKKAELSYLNTLYLAFVDIEGYLVEQEVLKEELEIVNKSYENSKKSFELSLNQYFKGLVEYTTVLDLQESFYTQEVSLVQKRVEIVKNRVNLYKALGGLLVIKEESK